MKKFINRQAASPQAALAAANAAKALLWVVEPTLAYDTIRFCGVQWVASKNGTTYVLDQATGQMTAEHLAGQAPPGRVHNFYDPKQGRFALGVGPDCGAFPPGPYTPGPYGVEKVRLGNGKIERSGLFAMAKDGRLFTDFIYQDARWGEGGALGFVRKQNKWAFMGPEGGLLTPFLFDDIDADPARAAADQTVAVAKGGKWGFVDHAGREVIPFLFDHAASVGVYDAAFVKYQGKYGLLDKEVTVLRLELAAAAEAPAPSKADGKKHVLCLGGPVALTNGQEWTLDLCDPTKRPSLKNGEVFVPLLAALDVTDANWTGAWESNLILWKKNDTLRVVPGQPWVWVNGKQVAAPHPPECRDGEWTLPLKLVTDAFSMKMTCKHGVIVVSSTAAHISAAEAAGYKERLLGDAFDASVKGAWYLHTGRACLPVEITAYTGGTLTLAAAPGAAGLGALGGAPLLFSVTDTYALYRQESPPGYVAGLLLRRQGDVLVLNDFQLAQAQGEAGGYEGVLRRTRETGAAALSQDCL